MKTIRRDERAEFTTSTIVATVVGVMIALMVGFILIPALSNQVYLVSKNTTIANTTKNPTAVGLSSLLPIPALMFIIAILGVAIGAVLYMVNKVE